ncbi:hypothetical protein ACIQMV_39005 [Streptomyces sp. NPDC091412]|uniref:hypothetical protein n=1 Tax=Streptomyces sp. NPDC091412 TaxID=3366002 RepID=UPI00381CB7FE
MRPYPRANRKLYPNATRAERQIRRAAYSQPCRVCAHPWNRHALVDGMRACTRGNHAPISCRDCAETAARMPATYAVNEFARVWSTRPESPVLRLASALAAVPRRR